MSHVLHTRRLGLMACLLFGLLPLPALAQEGGYASIKGGINGGPSADFGNGDVDGELGGAIVAALGYGWRDADGFRVESEVPGGGIPRMYVLGYGNEGDIDERKK